MTEICNVFCAYSISATALSNIITFNQGVVHKENPQFADVLFGQPQSTMMSSKAQISVFWRDDEMVLDNLVLADLI